MLGDRNSGKKDSRQLGLYMASDYHLAATSLVILTGACVLLRFR